MASILRYALPVWENGSYIESFSSPKKCVRSICGIPPWMSCKPVFKKFGILTFPSMYIFEIYKFVVHHFEIFTTAREKYRRNTRNSNKLVPDKCPKTALILRNCYWMCIRIYNKLPDDIKILPMTSHIKKLYQRLLDSNYYIIVLKNY